MNTIRKQITLCATIERVWEHITDPNKIAAWLMPNDFVAARGHEFSMRCEPREGSNGIVQCQIKEIEKPHRLVYSWVIDVPPLETLVSIHLAEVQEGTCLTLEHSGWAALEQSAFEITRRHDMGWEHLLGSRLRSLLADSIT